MSDKSFRDYWLEAADWITLSTGEFYPDVLPQACRYYAPVLEEFGSLLRTAPSSRSFFLSITDTPNQWMRTQLCRVFKKYVSPDTPVEMLKRKSQADWICSTYGNRFRDVALVQRKFSARPVPDEALCAILWEYKARGRKGYDLTEALFQLLRANLPGYRVVGPERAGPDVILSEALGGYPKHDRAVDFLISRVIE